MRTNVVIDDELMADALACTGLPTKRAVIEHALRTVVSLAAQAQARKLKGKLSWEGDLEQLRTARSFDVAG